MDVVYNNDEVEDDEFDNTRQQEEVVSEGKGKKVVMWEKVGVFELMEDVGQLLRILMKWTVMQKEKEQGLPNCHTQWTNCEKENGMMLWKNLKYQELSGILKKKAIV